MQTLRRVWVQQFFWQERELRWREITNRPAAGDCINSPYDPQTQYAKKRDTGWVGYKVHLTETCDNDLPHLITHVETNSTPLSDLTALAPIHEALEHHNLLPKRQLVDIGYVDAEALITSQQAYGVDLFGPSRDDYHWQARENTGFAAQQFVVDWEQECAIFPAGKTSSSLKF